MKRFIKFKVAVLTMLLLSLSYAFGQHAPKTAESILTKFKHPSNDHILVVAHRGDWRNAPENSIKAVEYAIAMGVDIVEIDVQKTKDSELVIIHDKTIDRTTTGKGKVSELLLDSIRKVKLRNGAGMPTRYHMATLKEMMLAVKGKPVLVNLDKAWDYIPETYRILKETNTVNQAIFKGNRSFKELRSAIGKLADSIIYMPMVWPVNYNIYKAAETEGPVTFTKEYIKEFKPIAFEVIYNAEDSPVLEAIKLMQEKKVTVWVNTLWPELCAGHDDENAMDDADAHWGWVIAHGANVMQTDRPAELIRYLEKKGLR
ncbi:glycerophosphodiester phosphodiesterase family protein [Pedobacter caeni]|uniref:Glycerophosphoryl diester phosphodiesterase n=1 Tax=Pedobacter caeni TaxID=288992 RepID=A0A1M4Z3J2_9SPHI|nr:glycerophosphodiester phosphodiesterase family protein [Pedobacter caeni]SHF12601.1 glycerophosphoryl diester phosphodiesterase [Pedobacter caeni]